MDRPTSSPIGIRDYVAVLRRRRGSVAAVAAAAVVASLVLSFTATKIYAATATIAVRQPDQAFAQPTGNVVHSAQDRDRLLQTLVAQLKSDNFRRDVLANMQPVPDIASIAISAADNADLVSVTVSSRYPSTARDIANAYAQAFVDQERLEGTQSLTQQSGELRQRAAQINTQLNSIDQQLTDAESKRAGVEALRAQRATLAAQYQDFTSRADELDVNAKLVEATGSKVDKAMLPTSPASPNPLRDMLVAGVLGLLVGLGVAFLIDLLDDRLKTLPEVHAAAPGLPILASIPRAPELSTGKVAVGAFPDSDTAESFRGLGVATRFLSLDREVKTLLVTSPMPGEGKTTVVANLAVTLGRAGRKVLVVDCDLRRPRLHEALLVPPGDEPDLLDVLSGDDALSKAVIEVPVAGGTSVWFLRFAGRLQDPVEVLSSQRLARVIEWLRDHFDFVLIDSAPIVPVADSLPLVKLVDAVMLVIAYRSTGRAVMTKSIESLERAGANQVGIVLSKVRPDAQAYGYAMYGYGELPTKAPRWAPGRRRAKHAPAPTSFAEKGAPMSTSEPGDVRIGGT